MSSPATPGFDGLAERDAIFARLGALCGGRIHRGIPDDAILAKDPITQDILPYIVTRFGRPIASTLDRGLGQDETQQPYLMVSTIVAYSPDARESEVVAAEITKLLLGWIPSTMASQLKVAGGYAFTKLDAMNHPVRFEEACQFVCYINL